LLERDLLVGQVGLAGESFGHRVSRKVERDFT
jgi:hypothetical protein